jgi:hypothetical protein
MIDWLVPDAQPTQLIHKLRCVCCWPLFVFLQDFAKAGAGGAGMMFTFHLEACADPATLTQDTPHPSVVDMANKVKQAGMKVTAWQAGSLPANYCTVLL